MVASRVRILTLETPSTTQRLTTSGLTIGYDENKQSGFADQNVEKRWSNLDALRDFRDCSRDIDRSISLRSKHRRWH
jgi:hypothetical protein